MTKFTLLDMTQNILSAMSSDEVNSISDTPESLQVAQIIKNKYYDIVSRGMLPEHNQLFQLVSSSNLTEPVLMTLPDGIGRVEWIKYFDTNPADGSNQVDQFGSYAHGLNTDLQNNSSGWSTTSTSTNTIALGVQVFTVSAGLNISLNNVATASVSTSPGISMSGTVQAYSGTQLTLNITSITGSGTYSSWKIVNTNGLANIPGYKYVTMLPIDQFMDMTAAFNPTDTDVYSFTFQDTSNNFPGGGFTFYYRNDRTPNYCCILSNYYVIFDAYDSTQDSILQSEKTMVFGQVVPTFSMVDTFIPDLDSQQFPLLINEAKSLAFFELKQQPHQLADKEVKRQWSTVQKNKSINNRPSYFNELANFGRRTGNYYGTRGFDQKTGNYGSYVTWQ